MRELPQEYHADLGVINDDNTPDMRKAPAITGARREPIPHQEGTFNANGSHS